MKGKLDTEMMSPGQAYFDLEGDDELRPSRSDDVSSNAAITWRGDAKDTGADATIVVVTNELHTRTYHVHKSLLCFGTKQSKYFNRVLVNKTIDTRKKSNRNKLPSCKVELLEKDADNFPIFLDYMYKGCASSCSGGTVLTATSTITSPTLASTFSEDDTHHNGVGQFEFINTGNSVSLRSLAKKFEVDSLLLEVNKFIQNDLTFKTGPKYLCLAFEYNDSRLLESAQRLCAENIDQISSKALLKLPLDLFRTVILSLESHGEENKDLSEYLSEVVCRYLEKHPMMMKAQLLLEMTDSLLMPYIAPEAAIGYTALLKQLSPDDVKSNWPGLVSLSRRCARAVVQEYGWTDFSVQSAISEYLEKTELPSNEGFQIDSLLFATSFASALQQAQDDYAIIAREQENLEGMVAELHQSVTYLEKVNSRKDEHLARQNKSIEEARAQVSRLKEQIGMIQRDQAKQLGGYSSPSHPSQSFDTYKPAETAMSRASTPKQGGYVCSSQKYSASLQERRSASVQQQFNYLQKASESTLLDDVMTQASPILELISPSRVGADVHSKKYKKIREMVTKNEMRSKSIISS